MIDFLVKLVFFLFYIVDDDWWVNLRILYDWLIIDVLMKLLWLKNVANSLHGGVTAALVDVVGSAVILTVEGVTTTGVSVEINVSYLDAAFVGVCICICTLLSICYCELIFTLNFFYIYYGLGDFLA